MQAQNLYLSVFKSTADANSTEYKETTAFDVTSPLPMQSSRPEARSMGFSSTVITVERNPATCHTLSLSHCYTEGRDYTSDAGVK